MVDGPTTDPSFHVEEYKALRAEIVDRIQSVRAVERESLLGVGAFYAWLVTQVNHEAPWVFVIVSILPIAVSFMAHFRRKAELQQIERLGRYLKDIESKYAMPKLAGWEHFLADPKRSRTKDASFGYWRNGTRYVIALTMVATLLFVVALFTGGLGTAPGSTSQRPATAALVAPTNP